MNLSIIAGTAALAAVTALPNNGTLVLYSGVQPATPETALSGNTALATFTLSATAFAAGTTSGGFEQQVASFVAASVAPTSAGTVVFARMFKSDGTTVVGDFTVGTTGTDIIIGSTALTTTVNVTISSFILKIPVS